MAESTETPKKPDDDSDDSDDDGLDALTLLLFMKELMDKRKKKKKKKNLDGKPTFPTTQDGLRLPAPVGHYPFTWEEMTTDLAALGFAFGDVILHKPEGNLGRAVAYETKDDRLWTTSLNKDNCVGLYSDFSKHKDEFEKYASPSTDE